MKIALVFLLGLALLGQAGSPEYFSPAHRISGVGVSRDDISRDLLEARTDLMIQSQTFSIMREPLAVAGAKRITTTATLQNLFKQAERQTGVPATLIEAIAYLESWGEAKAESPSGPKGIMQISGATARSMGLRVVSSTRYRTSKERVLVPAKGKKKAYYRTVTRKTPYTVTVRDDRMYPERAIPAAARYLASMEQRFGRDWAIFAYHCGQGCVAEMMELTRRARGIPRDELTVPRMFFSNSPAWNRELYQAVQQQMQRDWSPTYYFRIMRAQQLLAMYRKDPAAFAALSQEYRSEFASGPRAPHRLSVWLKRDDMLYRNPDDIRVNLGKKLVRALDRPEYLGYSLRILPDSPANLEFWSQASPSALGALAYIAFETRRMFEEMKSKEKFQPLPVTALVEPEDFVRGKQEGLSHTSGQVFDVDFSGLPPAEVEALRFVLNDLGWAGYLGFIEEGRENLHIGCSPTSREFFATVFNEALGKREETASNPQ
jgi:hypothetical protein